MELDFQGLTAGEATQIRDGAPDANGQPAEDYGPSSGTGMPCRHCLRIIPEGKAVLALAWRPFSGLHPYAELGPIFLCAEPCENGSGSVLPPVLSASPEYLVKAYTADERIRYGTGAIIPKAGVEARARELLADPEIAFVDIRSARNNCFLARVARADLG
ncbi:MAG: DUF1203 domain-containing protein [Pseudomonadota bacterium]